MRGSIKAGRRSGTWYLRVELPQVNGRRRQQRETYCGTKRDAERRLRDLIGEIERGTHQDGRTLPLTDLCERWIAATRYRVGAKTLSRYTSIVRLHIEPVLGGIAVDSLRPHHVETALATWFAGSRKDREAGNLSSRTVKHVLDTLRTICRWAVRMNMMARNPVESVTPPKVDAPEMRALTAAGVAELLAVARGSELEIPIIVAVGTGLRRGELLGLKWPDISLDARTLTVRRSIEMNNGVLNTKAPKTRRSARTISLPAFVVSALLAARTAQENARSALGFVEDEEEWAITRNDGSVWEPGAFSLAFARLVKRHGLRHVRLHDLRHTFGTLALSSGVDLKTVSGALGHATISMTANVYVHAVQSLREDAAARIDGALAEAVTGSTTEAIWRPPAQAVPQRCHAKKPPRAKQRNDGFFMVAPTGVEPVSPP